MISLLQFLQALVNDIFDHIIMGVEFVGKHFKKSALKSPLALILEFVVLSALLLYLARSSYVSNHASYKLFIFLLCCCAIYYIITIINGLRPKNWTERHEIKREKLQKQKSSIVANEQNENAKKETKLKFLVEGKPTNILVCMLALTVIYFMLYSMVDVLKIPHAFVVTVMVWLVTMGICIILLLINVIIWIVNKHR